MAQNNEQAITGILVGARYLMTGVNTPFTPTEAEALELAVTIINQRLLVHKAQNSDPTTDPVLARSLGN